MSITEGGDLLKRNKSMSGAPSSSSKKGVRFAIDGEPSSRDRKVKVSGNDNTGDSITDHDSELQAQTQFLRKKRPRQERPNEDEIDDIDDWGPEDDIDANDPDVIDAGGEIIPSERDLLIMKRERRLKRDNIGGADIFGDDETDDKSRGSKGTHIDSLTSLAWEGIPIEPFNMQQETSDGSGFFQGDTYVFRREQEEPDAWIDSLGDSSNNSRNRVSLARARGEEDGSDNDDKGDDNELDDANNDPLELWTQEELYAKLVPFVSDTETVAQAIVRYGNIIKRNNETSATFGTTQVKKSSSTGKRSSLDERSQDQRQEEKRSKSLKMAQDSLNEVTEAANALLLKGKVDIYQKTRNDLMKLFPKMHQQHVAGSTQRFAASITGEETTEREKVMWEYQGSQDGQMHGPYSTQEMLSWTKAGYFVGQSAVKIRSISNKEGASVSAPQKKSIKEDLLSDLMDDDDGVGGEEEGDSKPASSTAIRREWLMSDQVDFTKYC